MAAYLSSIYICLYWYFIKLLNLQQTLEFHLQGNLKDVFQQENSFIAVVVMFLQDFDYVLLTIVGIKVLLKKQRGVHTLPLLWLIAATVLLLNHKPVWYHHYLLLSIPLAWLATCGAMFAVESFKQQNWFSSFKLQNIQKPTLLGIAVSFFIFSLLVIPVKLTVNQWQNQDFIKQSQSHLDLMEEILQYKPSTHWLFTDIAIYSFYTDLPIPPEIAVLSRKRVASGELTSERLYSIMERYHPEQIVLGRFPEIYNQLETYINENYSKVYENKQAKHYILRNLKTRVVSFSLMPPGNQFPD